VVHYLFTKREIVTLHDVFLATVVSLYCVPAWSGSCSAADRNRLLRLDSFLWAKRLGFAIETYTYY